MRVSMLRPTSWWIAAAAVLLAGCHGPEGGAPRYLGSEAEYFTPSARIYFDTGTDEDDEVDLYRDGSLGPAVDFLAINWPILVRESSLSASKAKELGARMKELGGMQEREGGETENAEVATKQAERAAKVAELETELNRPNKSRLDGDWILGPRLSIGITSPASDSEDGSMTASGAPVLYLGAGLYLDLFKGDRQPNSNEGVGVRLEGGYIWGVTADEDIGDADDAAFFVGLTAFL